jgi:3-oxoacyl-[acyl-carrier protein] reductase
VIHTLKNKVALVTGASKGIGASIAKHLALAGAKVIVNYASSKADADRVATEIAAVGGEAIAIQGDFSKPEEVAATFADIKQRFGKVDILVNNAA